MMIELGHYALTLAMGAALIQAFLSAYGVFSKDLRSIDLGIRAGKISFYLVSLSFIVLVAGFLNNNFSVKYIAINSNAYLPWYYKISATWSGHEGSLLLWVWVLALWTFMVALKTTHLPPHFRGKVFTILGIITAGFLSFIILTSNPFERLLPGTDVQGFPLIGKDLNPLLQDIGLIFHPPLLYMGYVGFSVSFAFIVAALWEGRLDTVWARWVRPWTTAAWAFLTVGVALGSWWAYYELGWGGWWFWDPVENASFMPWLAGTALLHSLAVTEKRDVFKIWTAFLSITTFSLSLIGTFLVRSGVLTSVHAFVSDPSRGLYILMLLGLISGGAFLLLILRAHKLRSSGYFNWISREMGLLINNLILSVGCLIVFIGTLTPLLYDVLGWQRISIGAAYFNTKMLWILVLALVFLAFAPYLHWKKDRVQRLLVPFIFSLLIGSALSYGINRYFTPISWQATILLALTLIAAAMTLFDGYVQMSKQKGGFGLPSKSYLAMFVAHIGFLVCSTGIILTSSYSVAKDVYVKQGDTAELQDLTFTMKGLSKSENNLYQSTAIDFLVKNKEGKVITMMSPEKRNYTVTKMPLSESALKPGLIRDVYVALGEPHGKGAWSVRFQIKPYIRWIWLGALIMALSAWFVLRDRRYSMKK
ncbi:MAG: heme lyase CcmF/NrfE family subunit [Ostreibacterium sp.]